MNDVFAGVVSQFVTNNVEPIFQSEIFSPLTLSQLFYYKKIFSPEIEYGNSGYWRIMKPQICNLASCLSGNIRGTSQKPVIEALWSLSEIVAICGSLNSDWTMDDFVELLLDVGFMSFLKIAVSEFDPLEDILIFYPLMMLLTNITEGSKHFCISFATSEVFSTMLQIFENKYLSVRRLNKDPESLDSQLLNSAIISSFLVYIHVMDFYPESKINFQKFDGESFATEYLGSKSIQVKIVALLAVAISADTDDEHATQMLEATSSVISYLISNLHQALENSNRSILISNSFHSFKSSVKAIMKALTLLSRNALNAKSIVACGGLEWLCEVLKKTPATEIDDVTSTLDTLWALSFTENNKIVMNKNEQLVFQLKSLTNHRRREVTLTAKAILWEINEYKLQLPTQNTPVKDRKHVMISYSWSEQKTALKLRDRLKDAGFIVWIDVEKMKGLLSDRMAEAVEDSFAIILCVSEAYRVSHPCRSEANYGFELKKPLLPVIVEENYFPEGGWLRFLISNTLYYKIFADEMFERNITTILNYLTDLEEKNRIPSSQPKPTDAAGKNMINHSNNFDFRESDTSISSLSSDAKQLLHNVENPNQQRPPNTDTEVSCSKKICSKCCVLM